MSSRGRISYRCYQCNRESSTPLSAYARKTKHFCSQACYTKYQKGAIVGDNHHNWKGDNVGYYALHSWVERQLGKPLKCESCGTSEPRKYEWANKSGDYLRDVSDWLRLCTPCHRMHDKKLLIFREYCLHGHRLTLDVISITRSNSRRIFVCRLCRNASATRRRARLRSIHETRAIA